MKITSTRWNETSEQVYNNVIEELLNYEANSFNTDIKKTTFYRKIVTEQVNTEKQYFELDGDSIAYDIIYYSYDRVSFVDDAATEEISNTETGFIVIYSYMGKINYIINKYTGALPTLRRLLNYTSKDREVIVDNSLKISNDFFIWLIYKVYNKNNVFTKNNNSLVEEFDNQLTVNSIVGFKGNSDDEISRITADGDTIMNLISSLTFLLESNNLEFIKVNIQYREHKDIIFRINTNGSIMLDLKEYKGPHKTSRLNNTEIMIESSKTLLLVYNDILPLIAHWYKIEKDEDEWGREVYKKFLESLSIDIKGRIDDLKSKK